MLYLLQFLLAAVQFMLGAALFSFFNVVAWRVPRGKPVFAGRSACPACGAALSGWELAPVFGWLALRGRCRHCGAPIAPRYLAVELLGGALALGCRARFGADLAGPFGLRWAALLALVFLGLLTAVALADAETQRIPNRLSAAAAACALPAVWLMPEITLPERAIGAVCISVPMALLCLAVPGGFGGGDIKLMAAAGLFLGWKLTLLAAFLAILAGGGYGAWLLLTKKSGPRDHFAFGPFLCGGMAAALFFGGPMLQWYFQFFTF